MRLVPVEKLVKQNIQFDRPYLVKLHKYTYFVSYATEWDETIFFNDPKTDKEFTLEDINGLCRIEDD